MRRTSGIIALLAAIALMPPALAQTAASFPSRPMRIIIPLPPGGVTDGMARLIAQRMHEAWGQPVVPENRPGASQFIGAEAAAKAAPDGHTLFFANHQNMAMNAGLFAKLPYDPLRDFTAVSLVVITSLLLVAHPSVPAKDIRELVALARARPGQLNYGSQGNGSAGHVGTAMLAQMANVDMVHIAYKGPAAASQDLLGGQINLLFDSVFSQLGNVRSGKVKALGISSLQRHPLLPDVPTVAEQGYPGFEVIPWFGLVAPARTPRDVILKLNAEVVRAMNDEVQKKRLTDQGLVVVASTPEAFQERINAENAKWTRVIREMKITAD
ncbi:MAG: Bug family tripartite tricarboxylate transporter substrate binding protein [Burkholderiales bacterium]